MQLTRAIEHKCWASLKAFHLTACLLYMSSQHGWLFDDKYFKQHAIRL